MSSLKCQQCGLVNFIDATECKRCQSSLDDKDISGHPQIQNMHNPEEDSTNQNGSKPHRKHIPGEHNPTGTKSAKSKYILPIMGILALLFTLSFFVKTMILTKKADLMARGNNEVSTQIISDSGFNNPEANNNRNQVDNNSNKLVISSDYQETAKPSPVNKSTPRSIPMPSSEPDTNAKPTVNSANTSGGYFVEYSAPTPKPQGVFQRLSVPDGSANTGQTPSTTQREPMTVSGGVLNGKAINLVKPQYSDAARAIRVTGIVNVQVTIDVDGNVISANAVSGHPMLKQSAEYAARASKFNPTILSGEKVKVAGVLVYNFTPQ